MSTPTFGAVGVVTKWIPPDTEHIYIRLVIKDPFDQLLTLSTPTCGVVGAVGTTLPLPQGGVALDQQLLPRHPEDVHQAEREQHPTGQLLRLLLVGRVVVDGCQKHIILWGEWIYLIHNMLIIHRLTGCRNKRLFYNIMYIRRTSSSMDSTSIDILFINTMDFSLKLSPPPPNF